MTEDITYYSSPIGILKIVTSKSALTELSFVNEQNLPLDIPDKNTSIQLDCIRQLDEYFKGNIRLFNLPLQMNGTNFQQSVWAALQNIPFGRTTSYLQLSKILGNTKAIRAVGTANGSNPISIIVPCHRVIGSNGDLVGYAGELWRKKWLLNHEATFAHGVQTLF